MSRSYQKTLKQTTSANGGLSRKDKQKTKKFEAKKQLKENGKVNLGSSHVRQDFQSEQDLYNILRKFQSNFVTTGSYQTGVIYLFYEKCIKIVEFNIGKDLFNFNEDDLRRASKLLFNKWRSK